MGRIYNRWEQFNNQDNFGQAYEVFLDQIQGEESISKSSIEASPLALIRALDDYLASTRQPSSQSTRANQFTHPFEESEKAYWLIPVTLAARRTARMDHQPVRLARWFHHHTLLPTLTANGIDVSVQSSRSQLDSTLSQLLSQADCALRVWVAHFDDEADVQWDRSRSPVQNWRSMAVEPHAARQASLLRTLQTAQSEGAHVVVFPEFTLDLTHREQLAAHLRQATESSIQLVVAGAFHEPENTDSDLPAYNTAPVLNGNGTRLFSHRKLRIFGRDDLAAEFVDVGNSVTVLVTPIGCMTVLICKDFLDEDTRVDNLLAEVPVDWVWVPSYGDEKTLKLHKERAYKLATLTTGTSSAVAQTQNTATKAPGQTLNHLPGFAHTAGTTTPENVASTGSLVAFGLDQQPTPSKPPRRALKCIK
jgi:predicted amidohydrolase